VASLGLVSPGAATDGVIPIFLPKKLTTFFICRLLTTPGDTRLKLIFLWLNLEKNTKFGHKK